MNWFYLSFPYTPCLCFWGKCEKAEMACKWSKGGDVGSGWMAVEVGWIMHNLDHQVLK